MSEVLPRHQYTSFSDLTKRFGTTYISPKYRWLFLISVAVWRRLFRIDPLEKVIAKDFEQDRDGFWHQTWIWNEIFYPEISATFVGDAPKEDPILRAAQLINGAAEFYLKVITRTLPEERHSNRSQDMERYQYLFSRLTLASKEGTQLKHRITDLPKSDYVVVGIDRHILKVRIIKDDKPVSVNALKQAIQTELDHVADREYNRRYIPPIGILTALQNKISIHLWKHLEAKNPDVIKTLNEALFTVTIDPELKPKSLDETLKGLNTTIPDIRDSRRSLQIIVAGDGSFAAVVNPHAGIGGTLSARFVSELSVACHATISTEIDKIDPFLVERLAFANPHLNPLAIASLRGTIKSRLYPDSEVTAFQFSNIGAKTFKQKDIHVDAAFHAALTLAWFRQRGYMPTIGNFINLRSVKFGDIWRYDATTDAMRTFAYHPNLKNFKAAEHAHISLIKRHKSATDEFYLGAMALKRLVCEGMVRFSGFVSLVTILSIFVRDFNRRFLNPDIWVSCIPSFPGVQAAGRGGATMSYLGKTSTGGHYMIFADHIMICLMNSKKGKWRGTEKAFAEDLERCLHIVANL